VSDNEAGNFTVLQKVRKRQLEVSDNAYYEQLRIVS